MQTAPYPDVTPEFGHWFAGFVAGEGCFGIDTRNGGTCYGCRLAVKLRADDLPILEEIRRRLGLGYVYNYALRPRDPRHGPEASWCVISKGDCASMVRLFEAYPLRAKKAADFTIWTAAVQIWLSGAPDRWERMAALQATLRESRRFEGDLGAALDEVAPQLRLVV